MNTGKKAIPARFFVGIIAAYVSACVLFGAGLGFWQKTTLIYRLFDLLLLIFIWAAAYYAFLSLASYSKRIEGSPESASFKGLARGCRWLAWCLAVSSLVGLLLSALTHNNERLLHVAVIGTNYLNLVLLIIAFSIIAESTRKLLISTGSSAKPIRSAWLQVLLLLIGIGYCAIALQSFDKSSFISSNNNYMLPIWVAIITVLVPYLYVWFTGALTVLDVIRVSQKSPGIIYRRNLRYLAIGIAIVVVSFILLQVSQNSLVFSMQAGKTAVVRVIFFQILSLLGFSFISYAAHKLTRIEEA